MGGDVTAESELGKGSTFTVRLPARVTLADPSTVGDPGTPGGTGRNRTVLVIDDDPGARELMTRLLAKEGFHVLTAPDGEEGLRLARQVRPDLITLDVVMPRVDGWSVMTALKSDPDLADIPIVLLTVCDNHNLGFAMGAAEYLTKPIDRGRLSAVLKKYRDRCRKCSALVVEDDEVTRRMLRDMLEQEGWSVAEAGDGRSALASMAREPRADLARPDHVGDGRLRVRRDVARERVVADRPGRRRHIQGHRSGGPVEAQRRGEEDPVEGGIQPRGAAPRGAAGRGYVRGTLQAWEPGP